MGKVSDLSREWDRALGVTRSFSAASLQFAAQAAQLRKAEAEDAAAHAAELEAKDRQIEAVQEAHYADIRRIAELETELAKRKELAKRELSPLPESVRRVVDEMREQLGFAVTDIKAYRARDLVDWLDRHYPAPVPKWEKDAQYIENVARGFANEPVLMAIAARIREAGRGNSK